MDYINYKLFPNPKLTMGLYNLEYGVAQEE